MTAVKRCDVGIDDGVRRIAGLVPSVRVAGPRSSGPLRLRPFESRHQPGFGDRPGQTTAGEQGTSSCSRSPRTRTHDGRRGQSMLSIHNAVTTPENLLGVRAIGGAPADGGVAVTLRHPALVVSKAWQRHATAGYPEAPRAYAGRIERRNSLLQNIRKQERQMRGTRGGPRTRCWRQGMPATGIALKESAGR